MYPLQISKYASDGDDFGFIMSYAQLCVRVGV